MNIWIEALKLIVINAFIRDLLFKFIPDFPHNMIGYLANKFRRITSNALYLPELDGMRFLSLSLVTLFHVRGYFLEKTNLHFADDVKSYFWLNRFFVNADRSVPLFFAISGFILALPFANHYINGGKKTNLKQYYVRRLTRLEPPYFIVMICIFLAQLAMGTNTFHTLFPSLLASLIYSHNLIFHHPPLVTVVAWTLEVEIQFYLMAPFLFNVFALPAAARRTLLIALIITFVTLQQLFPPPFLSIYGSIQHFLVGILVADFYACDTGTDLFRNKWVAPFAPVFFLIMFLMPRWEETHDLSLLPLAISLPFMIGLMYYVILRNEIVKTIFSYKFIPIIGGMCYTTYLLHYTIISMLGRFTVRIHLTDYYIPNLFLQFTLLIIPILLMASVFYLYIERPFMSRKWINKLLKKEKQSEEVTVANV